MPPNIFEKPFRDLTPGDVRLFLESVSGEGMLWEGKGTAELRELKSHIREEVCALANQLGGYLIVGAVRDAGVWSLPGVPRGDLSEEPHDWISRVITGGLVNPPQFDVRCWDLGGSNLAAVVEVEPVAAPPTMTSGGVVWQRLVGETKKVTDARVLADLIRRGETARSRAEQRAIGRVREIMGPERIRAENLVGIALAPVASAEDVSGRLFVPAFQEELLSASALPTPPEMHASRTVPTAEQNRDGWVARVGDLGEELYEPMMWAVWTSWDSTVAVQYALAGHARVAARWDVDQIVRFGWTAASQLLPAITGVRHDPSALVHLALDVNAAGLGLRINGRQVTTGGRPLQRWVTMRAPTDDEIASVRRELQRTASGGAMIWEPEPDKPIP